jgi:hypothetical protein
MDVTDMNMDTQIYIFNEITKRINQVVDAEPYQEDAVDLKHWYERLFNAFEYYAFFVNKGRLTSSMDRYYRSFIDGYRKRLKNECPELSKTIDEVETDKLIELKLYFDIQVNKSLFD